MHPILKFILSWLVTLLAPFAILLVAVRLLLVPDFLRVEYHMPGFPADTYGFTTEDRIRWATPTLEYLVNDQGISYLAGLMFDNDAPIYNGRELSHMQDVKNVLQGLLNAWGWELLLLAVLGIWAWETDWLEAYRSGWRRGGFLLVLLLIGFSIFALTSFWDFFSWFHSLFFQGTSWQFAYSDTLIRLFPIRFWEDCCIFIGGFSLIVGLLFGLVLKPKAR